MAKPSLPIWQSMTTKLLLLCLLIVMVFGAIIGIMMSAFRTVDGLTNIIITRDVNRIIQNGQVARDLAGILTETNLLVSTFYGHDEVLQQGNETISRATDSILNRKMEGTLRNILKEFHSSLALFMEQCTTMNGLYNKVGAMDLLLHEVLTRLEENVAQKIVDLVLAGDDSMAYEQIGALIPSYRESLLQVTLYFSDLHPAQKNDQGVLKITELLDNLHLRLRTLLASDPVVSGYGQQLLAAVGDYRKIIDYFEIERLAFAKRLTVLNGVREQALATMKQTDEQSVSAALYMKEDITNITRRSLDSVVLIAATVAIILSLSIYVFLFWYIRRPMAAILRGIVSVGEGDLQVRIQLGRRDEWNVLEKALNRMIQELRETYDRMHANNTQLTLNHIEMERSMLLVESEIEQRQRAEKETEKLQHQLQHAQKMEAIGTLAGGVAHDFNNLLQGIQGYTELLLLGREENDSRELQEILRAAKRGGDLTRQLLTFSRKVESNLCPVDINKVISDLRGLLERTIPKMIDVTLHLKANLSFVNADASQLEQVLMNLAVNARDAMPDGGHLTIATEDIILDTKYNFVFPEMTPGPYVLLRVSDTGQGMNQETRDRIFDPFFTTKAIGKGTGLGLAIAYGIVKNHGGHIICYSEPTRGTTFKVYLPAIQHLEMASVDDQDREMPGGTETILLVDDEASIRDIGNRILMEFGYTVLSAADGESALQIYERDKDQIDLIILDIIMPGMGGKQCLKKLVADSAPSKIIVASGYADAPLKDCLQLGAHDCIQKPYDVGQMLRVIRRVLDA